jgi:hypothetical protein
MRSRATAIRISISFAMLFFLCGFGPDQADQIGADFIVTAAPVYKPLAALRGQERFPHGAQLLLVHEGKPELLVSGFAATADANVSFDGKSVLFAGKKNAAIPGRCGNSRWPIGRCATHVEHDRCNSPALSAGCTLRLCPAHPNRLPVGSTASINPSSASGESASDREILPLTYSNASSIPTDVLADGRILFESGFPLGSGTTPELFLVYSDGSGVESYRCDHGVPAGAESNWLPATLSSRTAPRWRDSLHPSRTKSAFPRREPNSRGAIAETESHAWLVSARNASDKHYAIKLWKPGAATMQSVLAESSNDLVEPVLIAPRNRPKRHPSGLHPWDYANLLALDARLSRDGTLKGTPVSVRLETEDANGRATSLGTAPVEQDGSYFVQVPGDRPIRFALLDAHGAVLRQEHGWFWARGGEQRICVGCHTGPERASENRIPAVLLRTTTPVDLTATHQGQAVPDSAGGRSK